MRKIVLYGLQLLVLSIPLESAIVVPGFGTISRLLGTIVLTIVMTVVLMSGKIRRLIPVHFFSITFVIWAGLSYLWSVDYELTRNRFITYLQLATMVWLIWQIAQRPHEQFRLMQAYVFGVYVASIYTVANFVAGTGPYASISRYVAFGYDPNDLAVTLALGIPFAWYLTVSQKKGIMFWVNIVSIPTTWLAILLTASRGGFLSAIVATFIIIIGYQSRYSLVRQIIAMLICVGLGLTALFILVPDSSYARLETIPAELLRGGDFSKRLPIWQSSIDVFLQHPLIGIGAGAFGTSIEPVFGAYIVAHNAFLSILIELGVVGFLLFAGALTSLLVLAQRMPSAQRKVWMILISSWAVGAFSLTWEYRKVTWLMLGLLAAQIGTLMPRETRGKILSGSDRHGVNLYRYLYIRKNTRIKSLADIGLSTSNETERSNSS